jgi:hypothetical protein
MVLFNVKGFIERYGLCDLIREILIPTVNRNGEHIHIMNPMKTTQYYCENYNGHDVVIRLKSDLENLELQLDRSLYTDIEKDYLSIRFNILVEDTMIGGPAKFDIHKFIMDNFDETYQNHIHIFINTRNFTPINYKYHEVIFVDSGEDVKIERIPTFGEMDTDISELDESHWDNTILEVAKYIQFIRDFLDKKLIYKEVYGVSVAEYEPRIKVNQVDQLKAAIAEIKDCSDIDEAYSQYIFDVVADNVFNIKEKHVTRRPERYYNLKY